MKILRSPIGAVVVALLAAVPGVPACARNGSVTSATPENTASSPPRTESAQTQTVAAANRLLRGEWAKTGTQPAAPADDATFIRRVTIDIAGTLPDEEQVRAFLNDSSPDKRAKLVDTLLASPAYAEFWADYWDDVLLGNDLQNARVDRQLFRRWLRTNFENNVRWDRLASALITATGDNTPSENGVEPNPAVNWFLKYSDSPQDMAGNASRIFLGVQIQCAQCHDHKTETWKQTDFQKFAATFARTKVVNDERAKMQPPPFRVTVTDIDRVRPGLLKEDMAWLSTTAPTTLDGRLLDKKQPRAALAQWMTSKENPWFAAAIVNRMWARFLGRGFVDPIDDFRPSNGADAPALLHLLAEDFKANGYDLKRLVRTIALTEAYGLSSSGGAEPPAGERKLWSRFRLQPMGPTELLHSLTKATALDAAVRQSQLDLERVQTELTKQYNFTFDTDESIDRDAFQGTVAQALTLMNSAAVATGTSTLPGAALSHLLATKTDDNERIAALYLRTLSRLPTPDEHAYWKNFIEHPATRARASLGKSEPTHARAADPLRKLETKAAGQRGANDTTRAYEDMFWALLNSSEFFFNH